MTGPRFHVGSVRQPRISQSLVEASSAWATGAAFRGGLAPALIAPFLLTT